MAMRIGAKGLVGVAAALLSLSALQAFALANVTLSGYISDSKCGAMHNAKDPDAACVNKCINGGAKPVFVDADGKVWAIDDPDAVKGHWGHHVAVEASVDPETKSVHVVKVTMLAQQ
jgi:hypothetical protein